MLNEFRKQLPLIITSMILGIGMGNTYQGITYTTPYKFIHSKIKEFKKI
jgi:hypothetical protein